MTDDAGSGAQPSYNQPSKNAARVLSLTHAVELLTSRREDAAIVSADHVERVREALLASDIYVDVGAGRSCEDADIASWRTFRTISIGTRDPAELTVAYLAGPEPSNDLLALLDLGLRPENIWAFEADPGMVTAGLNNLRDLRLRGIKFIPAKMDEYLVGTPRRFDIIYADTCGPLPSDKQKTTSLIVDIFRHGALAPLGVLITNFSRPNVNFEREMKTYSALVAAYLFPKGFVEQDGNMVEGPPVHGFELRCDDAEECFTTKVQGEFEVHYGAFITRHVMDIAEIIAPTMRLIASGLHKALFDPDLSKAAQRGRRFVRFDQEAFNEDAEESQEPEIDGDAITEPEFLTLIWTLSALGIFETDENFDIPGRTVRDFAKKWKNQFWGSRPGPISAEDAVASFYAWRNDHSLWSAAMQTIAAFPYRTEMPSLCDVPTDEVGFYPAFAQLGYPAHPNVREARRFRYVAEGKSTPMFLDVIAFDECRYVYDWLSASHLVSDDWSNLSSQMTFRCALDGIAKERRWFGDDFLYGCHVVGESEKFPTSELAARVDLSANL